MKVNRIYVEKCISLMVKFFADKKVSDITKGVR